MTKEEYKELIHNEVELFVEKTRSISREYAFSNNPYKIGDILRSVDKIIQVEEIDVFTSSLTYPFPQCVFIGEKLKSNLEPYKRKQRTDMLSENVIEKLN